MLQDEQRAVTLALLKEALALTHNLSHILSPLLCSKLYLQKMEDSIRCVSTDNIEQILDCSLDKITIGNKLHYNV